MKYVYLYKIEFIKDNDVSLYYIGMRVCECLPEDDEYLGSPKKYKSFWKNSSYSKKKKIIKIGNSELDYESFRDEEVILIKEAWNKDGIYSENGKCLNATAGKAIHPSINSGENSHMKKEEIKRKVIQTRKEKYGPKGMSEEAIQKIREIASNPEIIKKRVASFKKNREENPELVRKHKERMYTLIGGDKSPNKRPERRLAQALYQKKRFAEGKFHLLSPENRKKATESLKETYNKNPDLRIKASKKAKENFKKNPEIQKKMSEARKKWYEKNPEKAKLKNIKSALTRKKKHLLTKNTLENFFGE